jgi:hypothetical protein
MRHDDDKRTPSVTKPVEETPTRKSKLAKRIIGITCDKIRQHDAEHRDTFRADVDNDSELS